MAQMQKDFCYNFPEMVTVYQFSLGNLNKRILKQYLFLSEKLFIILKSNLRGNLTVFLLTLTYSWQGSVNYLLLHLRHSIKTYPIVAWVAGWLISDRKVYIPAHDNRIDLKLKHILLWSFALGIWPPSNLPILTCMWYHIIYNNISKIYHQFLLPLYQYTH